MVVEPSEKVVGRLSRRSGDSAELLAESIVVSVIKISRSDPSANEGFQAPDFVDFAFSFPEGGLERGDSLELSTVQESKPWNLVVEQVGPGDHVVCRRGSA